MLSPSVRSQIFLPTVEQENAVDFEEQVDRVVFHEEGGPPGPDVVFVDPKDFAAKLQSFRRTNNQNLVQSAKAYHAVSQYYPKFSELARAIASTSKLLSRNRKELGRHKVHLEMGPAGAAVTADLAYPLTFFGEPVHVWFSQALGLPCFKGATPNTPEAQAMAIIAGAMHRTQYHKQLALFSRLLRETEAALATEDEAIRVHYERRINHLLHHEAEVTHALGCLTEAVKHIQKDILSMRQVMRAERMSNLGSYETYFERARAMKRKFILHVGPTNSGKTHMALERLIEAGSGAYLAPLRLMALEGSERLNAVDFCSLITGEERRIIPQARFTSSTIEMANFGEEIPVCIIDEGQMLVDKDRGWAWTAALLGIPAKEIIVTGSADMVPHIQRIAAYLGAEIEIKQFERKTKLCVMDAPVTLDDLKRGDAIVVFSRREALALRGMLRDAGKTCSVIYGNLAPEVRMAESRRFSTGETDLLVATDAIGMGLNLPIQRILFWTVNKFDGKMDRLLHPNEVRQIAGRAGRYGIYDVGYVGAFDAASLAHIEAVIDTPHVMDTSSRFWVCPTPAHVEALSQCLGTTRLKAVLQFFMQSMLQQHEMYKSAYLEDMLTLANMLDKHTLTLADKFEFACVPIDVYNESMMVTFGNWVVQYGKRTLVDAPRSPEDLLTRGYSDTSLYEAEIGVKMCTLYMWLHFKFGECFTDAETCLATRAELNAYIETALRQRYLARKCPSCGKTIKKTAQSAGVCSECKALNHTQKGRSSHGPRRAKTRHH